MEDLFTLVFSEISEEKDFGAVVKEIESQMRELIESIHVHETEMERIKYEMYGILGLAEKELFKIGFKYGVQMMAELHMKK